MQIPSLPTDNLYKFIAIAGLIILIVSVVSPLSKFEQLTIERNDLITQYDIQIIKEGTHLKESEVFFEESKTFNEEFKTLVREQESLIKEYKNLEKLMGKNTFDKRLSEIREKEKQIDIKKKQLDIKGKQIDMKKNELDIAKAELEGENRRIKYLDGKLNFYGRVGLGGLIVGVFIAIVGFVLWYRKVQRYQDSFLKQQFIESSKSEKVDQVGGERK